MKPVQKWVITACVLFFFIGNAPLANADLPTVQDFFVTDVTTVSFSVIWAASEASTASVEVFEDAAGTIPVASAAIIPHPVNNGDAAIRLAAENNGVMKVMVTGLSFDTTYYFRTLTTSKSTVETAVHPPADLLEVTTEVQTVRTYESNGDTLPFSNDIIIEPCYLEDGVTPATGTLLMATVAGGHHPVTAFVGDGVESPNALIDLNNVFSSDSFESFDLAGGENMNLLNFQGILGNSFINNLSPFDNNLCEIKTASPAIAIGQNLISFPIEPNTTSTSSVLSEILDQISSIWSYNASESRWYFWDTDGPPFLNRLTELHAVTGYWLISGAEFSIKVYGQFSNDPVSIVPGANLVGIKGLKSIDILEAISPIYDQLESIWSYDPQNSRWIFYDTDGPAFLNRLSALDPGKAYWIIANDFCEF